MGKFVLLLFCMAGLALHGATTLSVRDFGAFGNGQTDDAAAIGRAVAVLGSMTDAELFFPAGYYRVATAGRPAIELSGVSHVGIRFAPGAVLYMDNGDATHAIEVRAPAEHVSFDGVAIEWSRAPEKPGAACAFVFAGGEAEERIHDVRLANCRLVNLPGHGAEFTRTDRVTVRGFVLVNGYGAGMRFRDANDLSLMNLNLGQAAGDALAILSAENEPTVSRRVSIRGFEADKGAGAGIRLDAVEELMLDSAKISGRSAGIVIESGGRRPPPRRAVISDVETDGCGFGIELRCSAPEDAAARRFDLAMSLLKLNNSANANLLLDNVDGVGVTRLRAERSRVRLIGVGDAALTDLTLRNGCLFSVEGESPLFAAEPSEEAGWPVQLNKVRVDRSSVVFSGVAGVSLKDSEISDSPESALTVSGARLSVVDGLKVVRPNRAGKEQTAAVSAAAEDLALRNLVLELDARSGIPLELSGGRIALHGKLSAPAGRYELTELLKLPTPLADDFPRVDMRIEVDFEGAIYELQSTPSP